MEPLHPDERLRWLRTSALFTVLAPVAVGLGQMTTYLPHFPLPFAWGYVLPLALVAAAWIPPRTDAQRRRRYTVGLLGCILAFLYPLLLLVTILTLWAFSGRPG